MSISFDEMKLEYVEELLNLAEWEYNQEYSKRNDLPQKFVGYEKYYIGI